MSARYPICDKMTFSIRVCLVAVYSMTALSAFDVSFRCFSEVMLRGDFETVVLWLPPFHRQRCLHLMSVSVSKCLCVCVCVLY